MGAKLAAVLLSSRSRLPYFPLDISQTFEYVFRLVNLFSKLVCDFEPTFAVSVKFEAQLGVIFLPFSLIGVILVPKVLGWD